MYQLLIIDSHFTFKLKFFSVKISGLQKGFIKTFSFLGDFYIFTFVYQCQRQFILYKDILWTRSLMVNSSDWSRNTTQAGSKVKVRNIVSSFPKFNVFKLIIDTYISLLVIIYVILKNSIYEKTDCKEREDVYLQILMLLSFVHVPLSGRWQRGIACLCLRWIEN